jgi:hypothetical protein
LAMRRDVNRASKHRRTPARLTSAARCTADTASSMECTTKPEARSSMISGAEPWRQAMTGVPADIASIMTRPKGSGQSIGNSSARALPRKRCFCCSSISPTNSMSGSCWTGHCRKNRFCHDHPSPYRAEVFRAVLSADVSSAPQDSRFRRRDGLASPKRSRRSHPLAQGADPDA